MIETMTKTTMTEKKFIKKSEKMEPPNNVLVIHDLITLNDILSYIEQLKVEEFENLVYLNNLNFNQTLQKTNEVYSALLEENSDESDTE